MSKRFERCKRPTHLTDKDRLTLEAVFAARYLTNRMVCRLFYSDSTFSWCKQRLRNLYDGGYVGKRWCYPNEPDVYFLGLQGRRYIAAQAGFAKEDVNKIAGVRGDCQAPILMMNHELTLSTLYVNAVLECRKYGLHFRWKNTRMLELDRLGVQPDAYVMVEGTQKHEAFIEFTAVMPSRSEMKRKLEGYEGLLKAHPVPVLWLTTSRNKLTQLRQAVLKCYHKDYFALGLIDEAGEFLTKKMWWWSASDEPVEFIKAPTRN
jgi:hypothetical protein